MPVSVKRGDPPEDESHIRVKKLVDEANSEFRTGLEPGAEREVIDWEALLAEQREERRKRLGIGLISLAAVGAVVWGWNAEGADPKLLSPQAMVASDPPPPFAEAPVPQPELDALAEVQSLFEQEKDELALAKSQHLLESNSAKAWAPELHWLRGRIFEERRVDCVRAAREFAGVLKEKGSRGDEAAYRRVRCLFRSGQTKAGRSAAQEYLHRDQPRRPEDVRGWLKRWQ